MIKPVDLTPAQYGIATKPVDSYEQQLYFSTQQSLQLGVFQVLGLNSGVFTPSVPDAAALLLVPAELLVMLDTDISNPPASVQPVVTIVGTDANNAALTGVATIQPPGYANMQELTFPKTYAAEATTTVTAGKLFKTITSVTITCGAELAPNNVKFIVCAVPSVSQYTKIGLKTKLDWDPKVPMPHSVQDGRNKGAFVKSGEIEEGKLSLVAKMPNWGDGLARINGVRVTGLVKVIAEDKVTTLHIFVLGLILTWKAAGGESIDPLTLTADGLFEASAFIPAH